MESEIFFLNNERSVRMVGVVLFMRRPMSELGSPAKKIAAECKENIVILS